MGLWEELQLDMDRHARIALVGGGGKTSILYKLAREALNGGRQVIVTTTTHMLPHPYLGLANDLDSLDKLLSQHGIAMFGQMEPSGKLAGKAGLEGYLKSGTVILVEADGSRGLPLKAPAEHEPVIPAWAGAVIAVAGLDCVGEPISQACHRSEQVCKLLGKAMDQRLTPQDVAAVLCSPDGGRKAVGNRAFRGALNKADTPLRAEYGELIQKELNGLGIPSAVTSFQEKERGGICWFS